MIKEHNPCMNCTRISIYIKIWLFPEIPKWVIFIKRAFLEYENFLCSSYTRISFQSWIYALLLNGFCYINNLCISGHAIRLHVHLKGDANSTPFQSNLFFFMLSSNICMSMRMKHNVLGMGVLWFQLQSSGQHFA